MEPAGLGDIMILEQRRAELHLAVQRIALQAYLRHDFVLRAVQQLLLAWDRAYLTLLLSDL